MRGGATGKSNVHSIAPDYIFPMPSNPFFLAGLGVVVGFLMGLTSFTGAIIVPALVLGYGLTQARAQGTAVALTLSPLQLPALYAFHRKGNIDWRLMRWMAPGVVVGCLIGAIVAQALSPMVLKLVFGVLLVYVGAYTLMLLTTSNIAKAVLMALAVTVCTAAIVGISRWHETRAVAANLN